MDEQAQKAAFRFLQEFFVGSLMAVAAAGCSASVEDLETLELLLEVPEAVDLGWLATGEAAQTRFRVENVGRASVLVSGAQVLAEEPGVKLTASVPSRWLGPRQSIEVEVSAVATDLPASPSLGSVLVNVDGLLAEDPRLPVVEVRGRVSRSGLIVEPNPLVIGPVPYLATETGTVTFRNLRAQPIELYALRVRGGRAQYEEAVTRGAFGPLPTVDAEDRLRVIAPNETLSFELEYTAPEGEGEAKEQAIWRVASCPAPECGETLVVQGVPDHEAPRAEVVPSGVHFGSTAVGAEVQRSIRVANVGFRPLVLSEVAFEGSTEFVVNLEDSVLEPGSRVRGEVRYAPRDLDIDNGALTFRTTDPLRPTVRVRITGQGVNLPPCRFEVVPSSVNFGTLEVFEARTRTVRVSNSGEDRCIVFDPRIEPNGTDEETFSFSPPATPSVPLGPGNSAQYSVKFEPTRPGRHEATLLLRSTAADTLRIPLLGRTPEGVLLSCTSARTTQVGSEVTLTAALSSGTSARSYRWRVLSSPTGDPEGDGTFSPNAEAGPSVGFIPRVLGNYQVEAEVEVETGELLTCTSRVSAESSGLRVHLTWDGAGDLDLHLHRGPPSPWFSFDDCHFDNLRPRWDRFQASGVGSNPVLDRDDTSGDGPEVIRIQTPNVGASYTVAVGHFEGAQGRTARVQIFCGRAAAQVDAASRSFQGGETGGCSNNDFWTVATVTFVAPDRCTVQNIDTYRSSQSACRTFD